MRIAALYLIFALLATAANIGSQALVIWVDPQHIVLSVLVGTGVGLILKYLLDKRYIFAYETRHIGQDSRLFLLYSFVGLFTTLIFWGFEWLFHMLYQSDALRYLGGVIGLAIGYSLKYALDRRFVFVRVS
ncbi:MAG: GtrA family protein [Gammaproteobacteria bacterium]|nr:GtrA family protein [Gammaproteobacteria bacterium]